MWADRFDRRTIKDFHEFMNNINVQEDRSASTITRDVPPIMEMKSKRGHQLQSCTPCHTVVHKCNSSPPHTSQWTELEIGTTEWAPALGIDLSNSRMSLITDIFGSISANHARCSMIAHGDIHWVESSKHTSIELNPLLHLSFHVNRLHVICNGLWSHLIFATAQAIWTKFKWTLSSTMNIHETNKANEYKTNTSIMLCEHTQYGHECDNSQEIPSST